MAVEKLGQVLEATNIARLAIAHLERSMLLAGLLTQERSPQLAILKTALAAVTDFSFERRDWDTRALEILSDTALVKILQDAIGS